MVQTVAGGIINTAAIADDQDAVQYSANAPISGYSVRYQQTPCTGPTQAWSWEVRSLNNIVY